MRFKQEHDKRFKLRPEQRVEIKELFNQGYTNKNLSEMFKVSTSTITCITRINLLINLEIGENITIVNNIPVL